MRFQRGMQITAAQPLFPISAPFDKPIDCVWSEPEIRQSIFVTVNTTIPLSGNGVPVEIFQIFENLKCGSSRIFVG